MTPTRPHLKQQVWVEFGCFLTCDERHGSRGDTVVGPDTGHIVQPLVVPWRGRHPDLAVVCHDEPSHQIVGIFLGKICQRGRHLVSELVAVTPRAAAAAVGFRVVDTIARESGFDVARLAKHPLERGEGAVGGVPLEGLSDVVPPARRRKLVGQLRNEC